ncbi:Mur ligase family protein [Hoeflea poritis]|uniref:Mur ligase family protein n=1 Tax=Hoeflea poritis TaxID=2993659 RepID=A0ABT4VTF8_9HYPH|nr:Mur ligase family protein [Hoeflea poritis]MDA4848000.1 Mur ligase family protein [Hoeflea poritis]
MHLDAVIAITGSCGKSTTAKLTAAALERRQGVFLGYGKNTPSGIRGAMFKMSSSARIWVQEVSGHEHDAMKEALDFVRPTIGVVTTIGMDHISNFESTEDIAVSKGQLVEILPPDGHAILNADDPLVSAMAGRTRAEVITFGSKADADIRLVSSSSAFPERLELRVCAGNEVVDIATQFVGERWTTSILAALATAHVLNVPLKQAAAGIKKVEPLRFKDEVYIHNGMTFIADTFKAPLWTMQSSVDIVKTASAARKVMIIGTISDYRGSARAKYARTAKAALDAAQLVIFFGHHSQRVRRLKADYPDRLFMFETYEELAAFLGDALKKGDLIYIKASGADHLERIVLASEKKPIACHLTNCGRSYTCNHCKYLYGNRRWYRRLLTRKAQA